MQTHQGAADTSVWSRGQAWAIYGFTMVYRETGEKNCLTTAQRAADYFIDNLPADGIPYWDFDAPGIPDASRDASAAAIAASGLLELSSLATDDQHQEKYRTAAEKILSSLVSPAYLDEAKASQGILKHATGNHPGAGEVDVSLIYGDYYFVESLLRYLHGVPSAGTGGYVH
jgi:unsaturated chondroitin disaccharide hydrolase